MANKKVLVVAPHPDDETLGVGGTLLKHKKQGDEIYWLIVTHVGESKDFPEDFRKKRSQEIEDVNRCYGFKKTFQLPYPPTRLDTYPLGDIIQNISKVMNEIEPEIIYLPNRSDVHSDHRITFEAVIACTKSFRYPFIKRVLMYETPSETEVASPSPNEVFIPNTLVDITDYLEDKLKIMAVYESEIGKHPFPRSPENIKALATFRGSMANVKYAEAFMLLREFC